MQKIIRRKIIKLKKNNYPNFTDLSIKQQKIYIRRQTTELLGSNKINFNLKEKDYTQLVNTKYLTMSLIIKKIRFYTKRLFQRNSLLLIPIHSTN